MSQLKCLIVGAGSIGALKDDKYDNIKTHPLTHANAITQHKDFELIGIVDKNTKQAFDASKKWGCINYNYLSHVMDQPDIIVIATNTKSHHDIMYEALELNPRVVVVEKPFCQDYFACNDIIREYEKANIPIFVNYNRRYIPEIQSLISELYKQELQAITFQYCRGLKRDGCHAVDILHWLCGESKSAKLCMDDEVKSVINGGENLDSSYTIHLSMERCNNVILQGLDEKYFKAFQIQVFTDKGLYVATDFFKFVKHFDLYDSEWGNFKALEAFSSNWKKVNLKNHLWYLYQNIINFLEGKDEILCTAENALAVHRLNLILGI